MKRKSDIPFSWLLDFFRRGDEHHRVCRICHKPIRRHEHWRQVRTGWFAPVYTVEHRDCKHPTIDPRETPYQRAKRLEPELPFDGTVWGESGHEINDFPVPAGDIYPSYGDSVDKKVQ